MKRPLGASEIEEARLVFGTSLAYDRVQVHEEARWPTWIGRIGAWLARDPAPARNAITLNNHVFMPLKVQTAATQLEENHWHDMAWLIHELTHCWQYQHRGLRYLFESVWVQLRLGLDSYRYGGEQGLRLAHQVGQRWQDFNPEQQGDIARDYYLALRQGADTSAFEPFIDALQRA